MQRTRHKTNEIPLFFCKSRRKQRVLAKTVTENQKFTPKRCWPRIFSAAYDVFHFPEYHPAAPTPTLALDLQHKAIGLKLALREHDKDMEQRITEKVLQNLSVRLEHDGVIAEVESLRKAIERLGKYNDK